MFLINGQIISSKKENNVEVVNFEQLDINLNKLSTTTIKKPKLQEISTLRLMDCFVDKFNKNDLCNNDAKKEIIPNLIRRLILPFYIPVIALICSFLLIKSNFLFSKKLLIYSTSFILLVFTELFIRYTGINYEIRIAYILLPFVITAITYMSLRHQISKINKSHE